MKPNVGLVSCYYDLEKHLFAEGDRKWETEKTGMEVSKEVRFTVQVDERTSLEQKEGLFLHQPRSEVKLANEATIHILLGQPRAHSTHADCQAGEGI